MLPKSYNPKTPSRILLVLTYVLSFSTTKDERHAPRMVEECEAAKGKLKVEFGEELREVVQVAILTGLLLRVLQDRVFEMENAGDVQYHRVRDAIVGIMNIRARVLAPTPMDVGQVEDLCERAVRTVTIGLEETNSPLSMLLQLGRECRAFVFVAADLVTSPESARHQRAKAKGRGRRVVKAAWTSGSRAKASLSRKDGVGMGSLGLPITDLARGTR